MGRCWLAPFGPYCQGAILHGILDLTVREPAPSAAEEDMVSTFKNVVVLSGQRTPTGHLDHRSG